MAPPPSFCSSCVPTTVDEEPESQDTMLSLQLRAHRLAWATLLARVFAIDVTECHHCGGQMRIVSALTDPTSIRAYLEGVGLPARPPPVAPPRRSLQPELEFAA